MTGDSAWSAGGSLALAKRMGRYLTDELRTLYTADSKAYPIYTSVHVSLDVGADLSRRPHAQREPGRFSYFSEGISKGSTEEQVADMSEVLSDAVIDKVTGLSTRRNSGLRRFFLGLSAVLVLLLAYSAIEPLLLRVRPVEFVSSDLPPTFDGLTIAFLTDIHHGPFFSRERVSDLVSRTNALAPDLILLGGDYVHRSSRYVVPVFEELSGLTAPVGVFGVLGNHDHWEDADLSRQAMAQAGIHALDNAGLWLGRGDDGGKRGGGDERIRLGGVADLLTGDPRWAPTLDGTTAADFVLVVAHNPDVAETLQDDRVDLMLSGHTHGGQVTAFGLWAPLIPSRYGQKYRTGLVGAPHTTVLVSNGIGTSRLRCASLRRRSS